VLFVDGNQGNDSIRGGYRNDILIGDGGDDLFNALTGKDLIIGSEGFDVINYSWSTAGVTVDLSTHTASGGDAEGDRITGIEGLIGSDFDDSLTGNDDDNTLNGKDGNDTLAGQGGDDQLVGHAGADILTGGDGLDRFNYKDLTDSLLDNIDHITDLQIASDLINAASAVANTEVTQLGNISSLDEADIQQLLDPATFLANQAATFTIADQTFLAINNDVAGFSTESDAIIEITGFSGNLADLEIV
jgi:Ca2+-binding RTX toxin-like protein